jgi:hypothetical protein
LSFNRHDGGLSRVGRAHTVLGEGLRLRDQLPGKHIGISGGLTSQGFADKPEPASMEHQRLLAQRPVRHDPGEEQDVIAGLDFGVWLAFDPGDRAA